MNDFLKKQVFSFIFYLTFYDIRFLDLFLALHYVR